LEIEEELPELRSAGSPSQLVGAKISKEFKKVRHAVEMLSLENAFDEEDISNFFDRVRRLANRDVEFVLEPKLDGLSASIVYKNGDLASAATRGDGSVGEDVTKNILTFSDVPKKIDQSGSLEVRGEVVMLKSNFQELNRRREMNGEKLFANPRNAAAGSLRQLNAAVTAGRNLRFFAYGAIGDERKFSTQMEVLDFLRRLGFTVSDRVKLCRNQPEALEFYYHMEKLRAELEYDVDGVVYKTNDLAVQEELGASSKCPRHSIAHKFPAERAQTSVLNITVQVGRTGNITPIAELKPVTVGGVVVSRATLHNRDELEKRDIRVGDRIVLQRAGDVIPQVLYPILEERPADSKIYQFPISCPSCGTPLVRRENEVAIRCPNALCEGQRIERLIHFVSKHAFDIDGLGEQNMRFFFRRNIIVGPEDIFRLRDKRLELRLEQEAGWGKQSVQNLFESIEKSKTISLDRFIYALGIPQVGRAVSRLVANFFRTYDEFLKCILNRQTERLYEIDGVGPSILDDFNAFFSNEDNLNQLKELAGDGVSAGVVTVVGVETHRDAPWAGMSVVFTGSLRNFSRGDVQKMAERLGARVSSSISAKTSLVVAGENAGQKLDKAQKLGLKILSEEDFLKIIEKR
ncbi:MAG: NAD-dependent DNA ligase LigA, partial [Holosporaceae bacterium]|nr:NAD-dependent DNA ligase LigA [Holosporaceae bacterium]